METSSSFPRKPVFMVMLMAVLVGCDGGPKMISISGTVTMDGKPLAEANVLFQPKDGGRPASGTTDEQGQFTLMTKRAGDGIAAGEYIVAVSKLLLSSSSPVDGLPNPTARHLPPKHLIPVKYASGKTSGLIVEVVPGMDPVKLELTSR